MLILNARKKEKKNDNKNNFLSETSFVVPHKSLKRFCPHIVAMQAISGSRKDCDSLFILNEVPCVTVVYMGRYFLHGIFPEYSGLFTYRYALKWTHKYLYMKV